MAAPENQRKKKLNKVEIEKKLSIFYFSGFAHIFVFPVSLSSLVWFVFSNIPSFLCVFVWHLFREGNDFNFRYFFLFSQWASFDGKTFDGKGKFLAPGFFDLNVSLGEPGLETKEDFETGTKAAMAGGFTGLAVMPHNQPTTDSKSQVEYIINKAKGNLVNYGKRN